MRDVFQFKFSPSNHTVEVIVTLQLLILILVIPCPVESSCFNTAGNGFPEYNLNDFNPQNFMIESYSLFQSEFWVCYLRVDPLQQGGKW